METNHYNQEDQPTSELLEDISQFVQHEHASTGQRFLNILIDNLLMQYGLGYVTGIVVGLLLVALFPDAARQLFVRRSEQNQFDVLLLSYAIIIFNYIVYYTSFEKIFKGYTLGKLITGTRAIRNDGKDLTFKDAILRTLSRLVPFEAFSGFGVPWHDTWTKTSVIKSR